jgi:acyl-CoA hydrolase
MVLLIEAWAQRYFSHVMEKVTDARFVMVALDKDGKPTPIPRCRPRNIRLSLAVGRPVNRAILANTIL